MEEDNEINENMLTMESLGTFLGYAMAVTLFVSGFISLIYLIFSESF